MREITILHVFPDQKFFDSTSYLYDGLKNVHNLYYLYTSDTNYHFKLIKKTEKVTLIHDYKEYLKLFSRKDIDVILFHSLRRSFLPIFNHIDKSKIVIWWSWGGDIYNTIYDDVEPLIKWELYKPQTKEYIKTHGCSDKNSGNSIKNKLRSIYHYLKLKKVVKRINYMIPCMSLDYQLIKEQCKFFKADIFPNGLTKYSFPFVQHKECGNILIGNSLTYTNNHLDIFEKIRDLQLSSDQKYIIPVNYGWGNAFGNNPDELISLAKIEESSVVWLKEYLNIEDYYKLYDNITHAIFGVLRQQALANIHKCFREGIKVFLYNDSLVAQQLKSDGYIFFSIEDDLTEQSLHDCLTEEEARHNYNLEAQRFDGHRLTEMERKLDLIFNNNH